MRASRRTALRCWAAAVEAIFGLALRSALGPQGGGDPLLL